MQKGAADTSGSLCVACSTDLHERSILIKNTLNVKSNIIWNRQIIHAAKLLFFHDIVVDDLSTNDGRYKKSSKCRNKHSLFPEKLCVP